VRIGAVLAPVNEWSSIVAATRHADGLGFDSVGLWDHYHSPKPEWGYVAGWSAMAGLAAATERVRLVQMVANNLHFDPGVIAKETSTLALQSTGRFELGIGAGDWPASFEAWGRPFPERDERVARLEESVAILRRAWSGEVFDFDGRFNVLRGACISPVPEQPPRVVVGVGKSRVLASSAVAYADELNVYADEDAIRFAQDAIARSARKVGISVFLSWEWDKWPRDPEREVDRWSRFGVERLFVSLGGADMPRRLDELAPMLTD
jgi:alkanesulfonate monooxygenase SsuD/methylene tetrahydromethanopterin reductase-like flavin-dependent oxidoreductase (luciferase family)